jgi:ribosome-binding factor A
VAEAIKREVSDLLAREVKDPRVHFATVMDVEVAEDLRFAKIFVSVMGSDEEKAESLEGLQHATGFLRSQLGARIRLRFTPEIRFYLDRSLDHAFRIEELLQGLKKEASGAQNEPQVEPPKKKRAAPRKKPPKEAP